MSEHNWDKSNWVKFPERPDVAELKALIEKQNDEINELERATVGYQRKIQELERMNTDKANELKRWVDKVMELERERDELDKDFWSMKNDYDKLVESLRAECDRLRGALKFAIQHLESMDGYSLVRGARREMSEALQTKEIK